MATSSEVSQVMGHKTNIKVFTGVEGTFAEYQYVLQQNSTFINCSSMKPGCQDVLDKLMADAAKFHDMHDRDVSKAAQGAQIDAKIKEMLRADNHFLGLLQIYTKGPAGKVAFAKKEGFVLHDKPILEGAAVYQLLAN